MPVEIRPAVFRDVSFVAAHMRDEDAAEIYCLFPDGSTSLDVAALSYANTEHAYCAWVSGSPVAAFGFSPDTPAGTVCSVWAFGTRAFTRAVPAISRYCTKVLAPRLLAEGVQRIEVRSIKGHDIAHNWLRRLGARREAVLRNWGKGGETFILWSWTDKEWKSNHVLQGKNPQDPAQTQSADP